MSAPTISVVVPMYNEEANLPELHARLSQMLERVDPNSEIIYVDDGSTDGTRAELEAILQRPQPVCVRAVQLPRRHGKTGALSAGFAVARGCVIATTDADMQEPPEVLPMLISRVRSGEAHLVVAWRQQRQDTPFRVMASRLFNAGIRWLTGLNLHDVNCGSKALKREVAEQLQGWLVSDMHRYLPVLAARMGYRVAEVPVPHVPRRRGRSRFGVSRYLRALLDILPISLMWWRGWVLWLAFVALSTLVMLGNPAAGAVSLAFALGWLAVALWFFIRRARS